MMEKKLAFVLVTVLVSAGLLIVVGNAVAGMGTSAEEALEEEWNNRVSSNVSLSSNMIYVPDNHAKIQWAVDNASAGDTIMVRDGTYIENVDVNKPMTLMSEKGPNSTIVQAANSDNVFEVGSDNVNIIGFTVKGADWKAGIHLNGVEYCNIFHNIVSNNYVGIRLKNSSNNMLITNIASSNRGFGILLYEMSSNNTIMSNIALNNSAGIDIRTGCNTLSNNSISNNDDYGICLWGSSENTLNNNSVLNNSYAIYLSYSGNNTLNNNIISNNDHGIYLWHSCDNILITNNNASNNKYGIFLSFSGNNTLSNNTILNNDDYGIRLYISSNNSLTNNTMTGNKYNFGLGGEYSYIRNIHTSIQNIDTSNTVDGKPIYYLINQKDKQIPSDAGFVGIINSINITVKDLTLTNNWEGVLLVNSSDSKIENISVSNNHCGVYLALRSNNNTMKNNNASNNDIGIFLYCSSDNTMKNNKMFGNEYNFGVEGCGFQDIDTSNKVNGKTVYYWVNQKNKRIPTDAGFVVLYNSINITMKDLTLTNNWEGVLLVNTNASKIENITVLNNNHWGIKLDESHDNTVIKNIIASNRAIGIWMDASNNNIIMNNNISNNGYHGIYCVVYSNNNKIYLNNFINNSQNVDSVES